MRNWLWKLLGKYNGENKGPCPALWLNQHLKKTMQGKWWTIIGGDKDIWKPWSLQWRRWLGKRRFADRTGRCSHLPEPDHWMLIFILRQIVFFTTFPPMYANPRWWYFDLVKPNPEEERTEGVPKPKAKPFCKVAPGGDGDASMVNNHWWYLSLCLSPSSRKYIITIVTQVYLHLINLVHS